MKKIQQKQPHNDRKNTNIMTLISSFNAINIL